MEALIAGHGASFIISAWKRNYAARQLGCSWMNLGSMGALVMHLGECFAVGGFKINGPPKNGKGPMSNEKELESSNEASQPQPTQAGRIKPCTELISKAMKCLENNNRECVMKMIEEAIRARCHDGRLIGVEVADKVRDLVHELWLVSDDEFRCELLRTLKDLDMASGWVRKALRMYTNTLNKWFIKCGIEWKSKVTRNNIVKMVEDPLREKFGWNEIRMCEEMWRFVGVDVNEFRRHGIEPCIWLNGLEELSDLRRPYWFGLVRSDLMVKKYNWEVELNLNTTSSIGAIFFPTLLKIIKIPGLKIEHKRKLAKYVDEVIGLSYYVDLSVDEWPWPIKLDADELEKILNDFNDEELAMFIAGEIDGDGTVWFRKKSLHTNCGL